MNENWQSGTTLMVLALLFCLAFTFVTYYTLRPQAPEAPQEVIIFPHPENAS